MHVVLIARVSMLNSMKGYTLQGNYFGTWEDLTTELTKTDILLRRKEYLKNEPNIAYRIIKEK